MALLEEVLAALNRWDAWRRITEAPGRLDALEKRVAVLEAAIKGKPGADCPGCGKPTYRVVKSKPMPHFAEMGGRIHEWKCADCGFTDEKPAAHG